MYGVVRNLMNRPMLDVVNSEGVLVSQLKTFSPGDFPHVTEVSGSSTSRIPAEKTCALFVRDSR